MAKPAVRIAALQFGFLLAVVAIVGRAAQLQIVQGDQWRREAERKRTEKVVLPARRGALYDRNGVPLAITQEFYHVGVAPNELEDRGTAFRLLVRHLGASAAALDREFRARKPWIYLHGPFNATQVQALRRVRGVHLTGDFQRFYPSRDLARPIIGGLSADRPVGGAGLELSLDAELQEIAERGLDDALAATRSRGGDVVFLDPRTGELLALASRQTEGGSAPRASVFTDPFEPGSTAKLFTAAALVARGRVDSGDAVFGE